MWLYLYTAGLGMGGSNPLVLLLPESDAIAFNQQATQTLDISLFTGSTLDFEELLTSNFVYVSSDLGFIQEVIGNLDLNRSLISELVFQDSIVSVAGNITFLSIVAKITPVFYIEHNIRTQFTSNMRAAIALNLETV